MRNYFDRELEDLHLDLIKMGSMVEKAIDDSIHALKKQDVTLAKSVMNKDDFIDDMEQQIEKKCLRILALQSPLAKDLRSVSAALKIITDLERIADHASDIADITIRLAGMTYVKPLAEIPKMAEVAKQMLRDALDSYVKSDIILAKEVCNKDDEVDAYFHEIIFELINFLKGSSEHAEQIIDLMFVVKYLERIGDHATNVGEWVVYNVTGEHKHLQNRGDSPESDA